MSDHVGTGIACLYSFIASTDRLLEVANGDAYTTGMSSSMMTMVQALMLSNAPRGVPKMGTPLDVDALINDYNSTCLGYMKRIEGEWFNASLDAPPQIEKDFFANLAKISGTSNDIRVGSGFAASRLSRCINPLKHDLLPSLLNRREHPNNSPINASSVNFVLGCSARSSCTISARYQISLNFLNSRG